MRIDISNIPSSAGFKMKAGSSKATDSLEEGDIVKSEVLSSRKGSIVLKTDGGQVFKARLDTDVRLSPGDRITLEVTGKEKGIITLSVRDGDAPPDEAVNRPGHGAELSDKGLEPYAEKLAGLDLPVTEESARAMRELLTQNPGMTPDEAAFIISNRLEADANLFKAALALLADGDKADVMITRLLALLRLPEAGGEQESGNTSPVLPGDPGQAATEPQLPAPGIFPSDNPFAAYGPERPAPGPQFAAPDAGTAYGIPNSGFSKAPLTELLKFITEGLIFTPEDGVRGGSESASTAQTIIPQSNGTMQSTNVEKYEEFSYKNVETIQQALAGQENPAPAVPANLLKPESGTSNPAFGIGGGEAPAIADTEHVTEPFRNDPAPRITHSGFPDAGKALAEILSGIQEFQGTPAPALERFSNMLFKIAGESAGISEGDTGMLKALFDKLFTRIERNGQNTGEKLKSAREELFARLAFIEEAISRASPPARTQLLEQTGKLMDHVRLLGSIDQFVYMQLPVIINDRQKAAELYLFKRKGGKKPDPGNVNILLALELENMGRLESLINFKNKDVSIHMDVRGEAEKKHFNDNTVMLHELLAEAGFKLTGVGITCTGKETTPLNALSSVGRFGSDRTGRIDFLI